jgi:hypothetical protein
VDQKRRSFAQVRDLIGDLACVAGDLRAIGVLPRLRGRTRLAVLGQVYGEAGAVLRMAQSATIVPDESLEQDLLARATNLWPLAAS